MPNSVWVDITVEEDGALAGTASEWEVVMAPTDDEEEAEAAAGGESNAVAGQEEEGEGVQEEEVEKEEEVKDEAWGRWKEELACLSEMGFFTQLDVCVGVLERLQPTDAEVRERESRAVRFCVVSLFVVRWDGVCLLLPVVPVVHEGRVCVFVCFLIKNI